MSIGLALGTQLGNTAGGGVGGGAVLHRSTFTAPDGTALASYTPEVGGAWVDVNGGVWGIQSGQARKTTAVAAQHYTRNVAAADCAIGATVAFGTGPNDGLIVRATALDTDGYYLIYANGPAWAITEYDGAAGFTNRASTTLAVAGTTARLVVALSGATITVYWAGSQLLTYGGATRNQASGTRFGLRSGGATTMAGFDNVVAYPAGAVSVPAGVA